jgi:hypothetical protein
MKEQPKGRGFGEEEELLSVLSEFINEIPPDMPLRVFADWNRRGRFCLLMEGEYVEYSFTLLWFLTGLGKRALRVQVLNTHPGTAVSASLYFKSCFACLAGRLSLK